MNFSKQKKNIIAAVAEHIVSVIVMFVTYKYAISILGLKTVGLWSIIIAIFSLSSIGNSGFASSAVKFVSKYFARNDSISILKVISITFLTVLSITIFLISCIFIFIQIFHNRLFTAEEYKLVSGVILIGSISFLTSTLGRVFLSSLDGLQLINYRSYIGIISKLTYGTLCVVLLHSHGLMGLIFAEFVQYVIVLVTSFLILWLKLKPISFKYLLPDKQIFKAIFTYGGSFQITSIFQMLMDPLTKFFLKKFGGLDTVALYDIAYKFFFQGRLLIVVVINTFVPYVSTLKEKSELEIKPLFLKVLKNGITLSIGLILLIFSILPLLFSFVNIIYNLELLQFSFLIAITLFLNLIAVTPFIFNLGTGLLKQNLLFTLIMGVLNFILCFLLGPYFGAQGILIACLCGQFAALFVLLVMVSRHYLISLKLFFDKATKFLILIFVFYLIVFYFIHSNFILKTLFESLLNLVLLIPLFFLLIKVNDTLKAITYKWLKVSKPIIQAIFKFQYPK
jgi:O-antigen/teichoic acid export membrane protein